MRGILTYHSIDTSGSPISVHPDAFDRHLAWLASGRVQVTTLDGLIALPASADAVAITFDDAFANFMEVAPRLLARGLPVTVFVVTDHVGTSNLWGGRPVPGIPALPLLDWPALIRLQEEGVALGAHSRTHPDLTGLGPAAVDEEVRGSADIIERRTGTRPTAFAYPYGRFDEATADRVADAFPYACTTEFRSLDIPEVPSRLPRLDMYYCQAAGRIEAWGTPAFRRWITLRRRLRSVRQWLV
jgi:peptidoglycan/xylan/chitin deacetylase (PgdA/CDA1 family)